MPSKLISRTSEDARLAALDSYSILDTLRERGFDDLTEIAAAVCGVPVSLVSFVAGSRQWFKAAHGIDVKETSRDVSFCAHTLETKQTLIVPDAHLDPRFRDNPLVAGDPHIRFYAGAPIVEKNGHVLGTVCVLDTKARTLVPEQVAALEALARQAVALLEQRAALVEMKRLAEENFQAFKLARQNQEQLQLAMDAAGLAAWYYDPVNSVVGGDDRMSSFFGLEMREAPASIWLNAIAEEDRARVAAEFAASLDGAPYDTKYRIRTNDEVRWVHARARQVSNSDLGVQLVGVCEDVTPETLLAENLGKTAERLALAQSISGAATFDWDLATDSIAWGQGCFGRSPFELSTSNDVFAVLPERDRELLRKVISSALENGERYIHEFRAFMPDGRLRWFYTSGKPLMNDEGKAVSVVGVNVDITDRKLAEEALLRSEKLAAVGRLASTISHEINNPLEAVTNLLYIVRTSEGLLPEHREHLELADRELARVSQITSQTLRFHRSPIAAMPIDIRSLLNEVLMLYKSRFTASGIEVRLELAEDLKLAGFEGDLRQVLNNLAGNAFDAMRQGGTLRFRARRCRNWKTSQQGSVITIADTGSGMDVTSRARVFEAFFSTKGIGGTGLGLWVSDRIMHKHNGRISFRSRTDTPRGTVFRLWLPNEAPDDANEGWAG